MMADLRALHLAENSDKCWEVQTVVSMAVSMGEKMGEKMVDQ